MLRIGIVGLPNVGKSTLFNALTRARAETSNYPFCTIDANLGVVAVPDDRLGVLREMFRQEKVVPATVHFVDIAGLVKGASHGEGLGNQFLGHIHEVDAILHLVRCFVAGHVSHVEGDLDPIRDINIVEAELLQADLATVERRLERSRRAARTGDHRAVEELHFVERLHQWLQSGSPASGLAVGQEHEEILYDLHLLTNKPILHVANLGEDPSAEEMEVESQLREWASARSASVLSIKAKLAADLSELPEEEAKEFSRELGLDDTALDAVIRACYQLLDVVTFFTAVGKELTAWTIRRGTAAKEAAGRIHTDLKEGFIKAEVAHYDTLVKAGSWHAAHEKGLIEVRGKDYVVQEGDVIHFRH